MVWVEEGMMANQRIGGGNCRQRKTLSEKACMTCQWVCDRGLIDKMVLNTVTGHGELGYVISSFTIAISVTKLSYVKVSEANLQDHTYTHCMQ